MALRPRLLLTMGDVAGIGPEIIARAWGDLLTFCSPIVVGDPQWLRRAVQLVGTKAVVRCVHHPAELPPQAEAIPCLLATEQDLGSVEPGQVSAAAGRAAYDFVTAAADQTLAGAADAVVTAPLHKEGLRAAGLPYPGHTEILAERTGTKRFAMMLYAGGIGVIHATLHVALRDVCRHLSRNGVLEKIRLLHGMMARLLGERGRPPRLAVAALNPHASDGGRFGDEEEQLIRPAVEAARAEQIDVQGPWPSDTLFRRALVNREFDGIVALYHDQGHIAFKLLYGWRAVNISVGLPLVRTSVAHGTAYDIAWRGKADATSLVEAARTAALLAAAAD